MNQFNEIQELLQEKADLSVGKIFDNLQHPKIPHKNISRACHFARLLFTHNIHPFRFTSVSAPHALKNWNKKLPFADAPDSEN